MLIGEIDQMTAGGKQMRPFRFPFSGVKLVMSRNIVVHGDEVDELWCKAKSRKAYIQMSIEVSGQDTEGLRGLRPCVVYATRLTRTMHISESRRTRSRVSNGNALFVV